MSQIVQIEVPDELAITMQKAPAELRREMRLAAAIKWYEMEILSQEKAAELAGLTRSGFLHELSRFGVTPFQETSSEIVHAVKELGR